MPKRWILPLRVNCSRSRVNQFWLWIWLEIVYRQVSLQLKPVSRGRVKADNSAHIVEILSTFPLLESLGLSETFIRWFPVLILRHPIRRMSGYFAQCDKSLPLIRNTPKLAQQPRPPRHRSLIQYALMALKRSSTLDSSLLEMGLLPRIEELVLESYECELCDEMCAIRSEDWMEKQRLQWRLSGADWVSVMGRLCQSCLTFLTHSPPSEK